jgi:HD-GYP domain-containing protein (c-di-GMP phosphodiesterase class II)
VSQTGPELTEQVRTAEVIASMCLATDLGMGFPFEHGLHATLTTMRLCEALGVDKDTQSDTYYACLLMYAGCTVDEVERSAIFGGNMTEHHTHRQFGSPIESLSGIVRALPSPDANPPRRAWQAATRLPRAARFVDQHFVAMCEVAGMLAERLGMPRSVQGLFPLLTERWDGKSVLKRASGDDIPLPIRIIHVGRDATYQRLIGDDEYVKEVMRGRSGKAFDPDLIAAFLRNADEILGPPEPTATSWDEVLSSEPQPSSTLDGPAIDRALKALGAFADMVSPYLTGHSSGVGDLAGSAAKLCGFDEHEAKKVQRAGFVHDLGRTAVSYRVWNKPGKLTADDREQVRLHPYHTERVLTQSPFLAELGSIAMAHHERLDGSGYHRGLDVSALSPAARLVAVADAYRSKTEPRPYREALAPDKATAVLAEKAERGGLDPEMVRAVAEAAGQTPPTIERRSGLTEREVEVVGLLARGLQTKQIGRALDISPKTVDRHIQNSYRKMGVSSRAAATLFAAENGLVSR